MKKKMKRYISGWLAICMTITMLSPVASIQSEAVEPGEESVIKFNINDGPDTNIPDNKLVGRAGYPIYGDGENYDYSYLDPDLEADPEFPRPALPKWEANTWEGYKFDGWYGANGALITELRYAFPYASETVYTAKWVGNPAGTTYTFKTLHERTVTKINGEDITLNLSADVVQNGVVAGETVMTGYNRNIMGYVHAGHSYVPDTHRTYEEYANDSDTRSGKTIGYFSSSHNFTGTMPNENLEVTYFYQPDMSKKFAFVVEYQDIHGNTINPPATEKHSVEENISAAPIAITGYNILSGSIIEGDAYGNDGVYPLSVFGSGIDGNYNFVGKMPNQKVTLRYVYEIDPNYTIPVSVVYKDENGTDLRASGLIGNDIPSVYNVTPGNSFLVPTPDLSEYGYHEIKNVSTTQQSGIGLNWAVENGNMVYTTLVATPTQNPDTIVIQYVEDVNNQDVWMWVEYQSNEYGSISGDSSPKRHYRTTYDLDEVVSHLDTSPMANYMFDGWYIVDDFGNHIEKVTDTIDLGNYDRIRLQAYFIENSANWIDVSFTSGPNGSISGEPIYHVVRGTRWNEVMIPTVTSDAYYDFDGWYDSLGMKVDVSANITFPGTMTYEARFVSMYPDPDEDVLNIPNAVGYIADNARGAIAVTDANAGRRYVLASMDNEILAIESGSRLNAGNQFIDLDPSTKYQVYELASDAPANIVAGTSITNIEASKRSLPARVKVLALGSNYQIEEISRDSSEAKLLITPAAETTQYAVLDENGNAVPQESGDSNGWVTPQGSPLSLELTGMEIGGLYTVVARQLGETISPESKEELGSPVYAYTGENQSSYYVVEVIGGTINRVGTEIIGESVYTEAKAGQTVRIEATESGFQSWKVLIGNIPDFTGSAVNHASPGFTMPAGNVVLMAVYDRDDGTGTATASNASIEYQVNAGYEGQVALDLARDKEEALLENFLIPEDFTAISNGKKIIYRIQFLKRLASTSMKNRIRQEINDYAEITQTGWAIDTSVYRYIDNQRRSLPADYNPGEFEVLIQLDEKYQNKHDYQLWKLLDDGSVTPVMLEPDPNEFAEYNGLFRFNGEIDSTYVISYSETYTVTIRNLVTGNVESFNVRKGGSLDEAEGFDEWVEPVADYDINNNLWYYEGLSTSSSGLVEYDTSAPVTRNRELYAYYKNSDSDWEDAKKKLEEKMQEAEDLRNSSKTSEEDKQRLKDAIEDAQDLLDKYPRATTEELIQEKEKLENLIKEIKNSNGGGNGNGNGGGNNGGGSSGGSGSGSGGSGAIKAGQDGQWQLIDAENHKWVFVLNSGTRVTSGWERLSYTFNNITQTYYYYFDSEGIMSSGWIADDTGKWYYLSTKHDGWFGRMLTGWHYNEEDGRWYYLNPETGEAVSGWNEIDGKWYYFTNYNRENTYHYNTETKQWMYNGSQEWPWGSLLTDGITPDGYKVDAKGIWEN